MNLCPAVTVSRQPFFKCELVQRCAYNARSGQQLIFTLFLWDMKKIELIVFWSLFQGAGLVDICLKKLWFLKIFVCWRRASSGLNRPQFAGSYPKPSVNNYVHILHWKRIGCKLFFPATFSHIRGLVLCLLCHSVLRRVRTADPDSSSSRQPPPTSDCRHFLEAGVHCLHPPPGSAPNKSTLWLEEKFYMSTVRWKSNLSENKRCGDQPLTFILAYTINDIVFLYDHVLTLKCKTHTILIKRSRITLIMIWCLSELWKCIVPVLTLSFAFCGTL